MTIGTLCHRMRETLDYPEEAFFMFADIRFSVRLIILLVCVSCSYGQTTVWLSDKATFADLDVTTAAQPGTTGSFDIWIKTEHSDRLVGVGLDLMAVGEAIEFTGADIVIGRNRFVFHGNPTVMHDGATITNLWTFTGLGGGSPGIGPGIPVDDEALGRTGLLRFTTALLAWEQATCSPEWVNSSFYGPIAEAQI
jgi:hypothetical protein